MCKKMRSTPPLVQMLCAPCYNSNFVLLPLPCFFCPITLVIHHTPFLSFCFEKESLQCCSGMNNLLPLSPCLFSTLACPKYLHRSAPNMQIFSPKCTPELIQVFRDCGAVLNRLKRAWFSFDSLVRRTIGSMLR